jgi:hypothetical protein
VRSDENIVKLSEEFVRLRLTYLRGVNIGLFAYDYDQTWMGFFLDADCRIYSRYGSRSAAASDSHNSAEGLLHTIRQVLAVHKEEITRDLPPVKLPKTVPADLPGLHALGHGGSCVRCHMVHEALYNQKQKDGTFGPSALWLYPLPDNVGLKLDPKLGNVVREVVADSFADTAGMKPGDRLRSANGTRVITIADLQFVLNGLDATSKLTLDLERDGRLATATLELEGDWKRWDVTWRKSVRLTTWRAAPLTRQWIGLHPKDRADLGVAEGNLALRVLGDTPDGQKLGLRKEDVIVAFDGKRKVSLVNPALYMYLEHKSGDKMEITFLRDRKEQTVTLVVP